jgi:hypothetical protein
LPDTYFIGEWSNSPTGAELEPVVEDGTGIWSIWTAGSTWTEAKECFDGYCFFPYRIKVINSNVDIEIKDPTETIVYTTTVTTTANGYDYPPSGGFSWPQAGFQLEVPYAEFATVEGTYTLGMSSEACLPDIFYSNPLIVTAETCDDPYSADGWQGTFSISADQIPPPSVIEVPIDIKPGSDPNSINRCSRGVVPVAILGSDTFDTSQIDPITVELAGAEIAYRGKHAFWAYGEDVNNDGYPDMVIHLETENLQLEEGAVTAILSGKLLDEY